MRTSNIFAKIFTAFSAVMMSLSLSVMTAFCAENETRSSPETSMSGGNNRICIIIGITLVAVGTVGFALLKIREREKEKT